jgi:ribosomal protein L4
MKKNIFMLSLLLAITSLSSVFAQTKESVNELLTSYYGIKNALVAEEGELASAKASEFVKTLSNVKVDKMTAKEQKTWAEYAEKLKLEAGNIEKVKDVAAQRNHFNDLSNNLFQLLKAFKVNTAEVYQQYCPMKKTYWLSESSDIKNPYYGNKMLTCGRVTETLKSNK